MLVTIDFDFWTLQISWHLLKAYGIKEAKGFFPYEYLQRYNQVDEKKLPPHIAFYSNLQQKNISEEDYQFCVDIWQKQNMTCLRDFFRVV